MKKTPVITVLSMVVCIALIAAMALTTTGCSTTNPSVSAADKTFTLLVVDANGAESSKTITTDKKTVGEALLHLGIVQGEDGPYGLYIKTVNGITADFDKDGQYWSFYVNGQYASKSADMTDIVDGATYALKVEK